MHKVILEHYVVAPEEGLLLGNGDFSVSIYNRPALIVWRFGKNDVWDRRHDIAADPKPMHIDELRRGIVQEGWLFDPEQHCSVATRGSENPERVRELTQYGPPSYRNRPYPCPKPVGELSLHLPADQHDLKMTQTLTIERGCVDIDCRWASGICLKIHCFIVPIPNVFVARWSIGDADGGKATWLSFPVWFSLYRWPDPSPAEFARRRLALIEADQFGKHCNPSVTPLDPPTTQQLDGRWIIHQQFAPDLQYPDGFAYALLPVAPAATVSQVPAFGSGEARVKINPPVDACGGTVALAISTSGDEGGWQGALRKFVARIADDPAAAFEKWQGDSVASATEFWSRSAVNIDDDLLEDLWYETLHARRCTYRADVVAPGLFLPSTVDDMSLWHGDYHTNYNYQSPFWGGYVANHISIADAYFPGFQYMLDLGRRLAPEFWNCRGTFIQLTGYPFPVAEDPYCVGPFSRMAYMTGWAVNQYWFRYLYTQDDHWLRDVGYPALRDAALFYTDFMTKGEDGLYHAFPSDQGENQFSPDPANYTDRPQVMRHARYCLQSAADAADILDVDSELRETWRNMLANFAHVDDFEAMSFSAEDRRRYDLNPPEFLASDTGRTIRRADSEPDYLRLEPGNALWSWYFGHFPWRWMMNIRAGAFKPDRDIAAVKQIISRWRLPNGLLRAMAFATYGFAGAWAESLGIIGPLQEMMLQSFDGVMRVFPAWPSGTDASFATLRAVGAFLVSARFAGGQVTELTITSERGRCCRVAKPWPGKVTVTDSAGEHIACELAGDVLAFDTAPGETYHLARA